MGTQALLVISKRAKQLSALARWMLSCLIQRFFRTTCSANCALRSPVAAWTALEMRGRASLRFLILLMVLRNFILRAFCLSKYFRYSGVPTGGGAMANRSNTLQAEAPIVDKSEPALQQDTYLWSPHDVIHKRGFQKRYRFRI